MSEFPQPVDVPVDEQDSVIVEVLREYVRPGMVESAVRTVVPIVIGAVLAWLAAHWNIVVPAGASSTFVIIVTGAVIAVYYIVARVIEKRYPRIGRVLLALGLTKAKPVYAEPATAKAVAGGDAAPVPANQSSR